MLNHHSRPKPGGLRRILHAAGYSIKGFQAAWKFEASFRQECYLLLVMFPLSFLMAETPLQWAALIASVLLVLLTELLNSAIESAVDRFGVEHHELVGRAKDLGSAAVFISLCIFALVWAAVLIQRFL